MVAEGGHIDFMFLAPPLTRQLDPMLLSNSIPVTGPSSQFPLDLYLIRWESTCHSLPFTFTQTRTEVKKILRTTWREPRGQVGWTIQQTKLSGKGGYRIEAAEAGPEDHVPSNTDTSITNCIAIDCTSCGTALGNNKKSKKYTTLPFCCW